MTASSPPRAAQAPALSLAATLTALEIKIGLRSAAFKFLLLAMALIGWSVGSSPGLGVGLSAYAAGDAAWQFGGFLAILVMSLAAIRESLLRTEVMIFSKPQPTERLVLVRFAAGYVQILVGLAVLFLAAIASRAAGGGHLTGASAYWIQFVRAACVVFFASSAAFSLALLANNALAGALVALFWILTMAGRSYLPKLLYPAYTQNLLFFLLIGCLLLGLAMLLYRRQRRGAARAPVGVRAVVPLALLLACFGLWNSIRNGHDPALVAHPAMNAMEQQNIVVGEKAPGFQLPDQHGTIRSLSDFPDRILLIGLFDAGDAEAVTMLERFQALGQKYGARGVQPIAICLSQDNGAAATYARGESLTYPVVSDWGSHNSPTVQEMSPIATAYQAASLPRVIITDRRRRVVNVVSGVGAYDGGELETAVQQRLAQEPE